MQTVLVNHALNKTNANKTNVKQNHKWRQHYSGQVGQPSHIHRLN